MSDVERSGLVYRIMCANGKSYVGQTIQKLRRRFRQHLADASQYDSLLHRAVRKYGEKAFAIEVLELDVSVSELDVAERFWVNWYGTVTPGGYNATSGGWGRKCVSERTRRLLSASHRGKRHSVETRRKMSITRLNAPPMSAEWCAHISEGKRGKPRTDETKARISAAKLGRKHTDAARENMRVAQLKRRAAGARNPPITEESRQRMSLAAKNRKPPSPETCRRLSEAIKRSWDRRKALTP